MGTRKKRTKMFDYFKKIAITKRADDEVLYEYVLNEMEDGYIVKGLWGKALANSNGNDANTKSIYMKYRVQSIKDIFIAKKIAYNELTKPTLLQYISDKILPISNDFIDIKHLSPAQEELNDNYLVDESEEKIYNKVAQELQDGIRKEGLWLKAIENTNGDENKALALYIKYRSESIKVEKLKEVQRQKLLAEQKIEERRKELELEILQNQNKLKIFLEKHNLHKIKDVSKTKILANYYNSPIDVYVEFIDGEWKIID
jgi:hypothetical protein